MRRVSVRGLRNDVGGVLRRVEAGESFEVTLRGRAVAHLTPLPRRSRWVSWDDFFKDADQWRADPGLTRELAEMTPDTTDDIPLG